MSIAIVRKKDCDVKDLISRAIILENVPNAEDKLKRWLRTSDQVWLGMHDDRVACIWGLAPSSAISNRAYLWLLTTDIVDQHKFLFVRHSQMVLDEALDIYPQIIGHVEMHNERAKKWLKWLGARFGDPVDDYMPFTIVRRK